MTSALVDVAKRFPRTSLKEAYERSQQTERWIFPDTIHSTLTLVYGRSNVGKSYLVASMLLSLLIDGREFLGMQPTDKTKLWKPAILWTDPGSDEEYGERICDALPDDVDVEVPMFHVGRTTRPDEWDALTDTLLGEGFNFVVLDNLSGAAGDTNDAAALTTVFDGLTKLVCRGVGVVVLHHESEKGYSTPGAPPMGRSIPTQKARAWIQVRQTARRRLRGGNTALVIQGNALSQPQQIVAEPLTGPSYRVLNRQPWGDAPGQEQNQERSKMRFDANDELLAWLNTSCRGMTLRQAADKLAADRGCKPEAAKSRITRAGIRKDGDAWVARADTPTPTH